MHGIRTDWSHNEGPTSSNLPFWQPPPRLERQPAPVVVVDDSEAVCRALERDLNRLGYQSRSFATPEAAVVYLLDGHNPVERVVVDLKLGEHDGMDLLGFVAKRRPAARRVLFSGMVGPGELGRYRAAGRVHAVMAKPWDRAALAAALEL